jgi:hypothetical protein
VSPGRQLKAGFKMLLTQVGGDVLIHRNHGAPDQTTCTARGLKNNKKNRPNEVMFQFPERVDIEHGDVLQQKGASDLWRVTETEDHVVSDTYLYFEAKVEMIGAAPRNSRTGNVIVQGHNYGGIQLNATRGTQNVSSQVVAISEPIYKLRELLKSGDIGELDREEAENALERISQLAQKERTPEVLGRIKDKLDVVNGIFAVAANLATLASPYIDVISRAIGLS